MIDNQQEELKFIQPSLPQQPPFIQPKIAHQSSFKESYLKQMSSYMSTYTKQSLLSRLKNYHIYEQAIETNKHVAFLKIDCSKSCQILEVDVKIGFILLKIRIINIEGASPVHCSEYVGSGSFGRIYKYQSLKSTKAVKCFEVNERGKLEDSLAMAITQYSFLKIASIVQSGPQIGRNSFDIYIYKYQIKSKQTDKIETKYCIQFQTQFCDASMSFSQKDKQSLFKSLYCLHILGITHCDIKPDNVMYSFTHNKWIFIDFGVSCAVKQPIGHNTKTKYRGTLKYSGEQMKKLYKIIFINKQYQQQFIDLYWNDIQGLKLTCIDLQKRNKTAPMMPYAQSKDKQNEKLQQHFLVTNFKYWLYFGSQLAGQYFIQNIRWDRFNQQGIIFFLLELKYIPQKIRILYVNFLQARKVQPHELKVLQKLLADVKSSLNYDEQQQNRYQRQVNPKYLFFKEIPKALQFAQLEDNKNQHLSFLSKNKQIKDLFVYLKNYKKQAQQQEQYYLAMLFNSVNFLKKQCNFSLGSKIQICRKFHQLYGDQQQFNNHLDYIKYFIQYSLQYCLHNRGANLLKEYIIQIYSNYLLLGLKDMQVIKAMHQTIFNLSSNQIKICQYFLQLYNIHFWCQQQINEQSSKDQFEIKQYVRSVMYRIYKSLNKPADPNHTNCNQTYCLDMEPFMLKCIQEQASILSSNHLIQQGQFEQKISKCLQILKSFKTKIKRHGTEKIQVNKVINQIPMNLREFFIPQFYVLNPQSWSRISYFIYRFLECEQISKNWAFVFKMKSFHNLDKYIKGQSYQQAILKDNKKNIHRLHAYYEILIQLIYSQQKTMAILQKTRQQYTAIYIEAFINYGNLYSQDELAWFLSSLNQLESRCIWYYIQSIYQKYPQRVIITLNLLYDNIKQQKCQIKKQYKLLKLAQFIFRKQIQIREFTISNEQFITECKEQRQCFEIKLKYLQAKILELRSDKRCERYLLKFYEVIQRNKRYNDFILKNIFYAVYQQLITLLLRSSKIQETINLICNLSQHLFYLLSKQTSILNKKIKYLIYNLFVFKSHQYFKCWQVFRKMFVERSLRSKDKISIFFNLNTILVQNRYSQLAKSYYSNKIPVLVIPNNFIFLGYKQIRKLLYQFSKMLSCKIPVFQMYQVQNYYQGFLYLIEKHKEASFLRERYIQYVIKLHRKSIIQILPLDIPWDHYWVRCLQKNQYSINIVIKRSEIGYLKDVEQPAKQAFKSKIGQIIAAYKGAVVKKVKFIK